MHPHEQNHTQPGEAPNRLLLAGRGLLLALILFAEDLAAAFRISVSAARKRLARGDFGPRFKVGRRWAVRRESLLEHLAGLESMPEVRPGPPPVPKPKPEYMKLLRRHRGRGA